MSRSDGRDGGLRQRHRERVRRELLDATSAIITSQGEHGLTVTRVAEEVDCSIGTIYRYFATKEALVDAYWAERLDALHDRQAGPAADDDADPLSRITARARFWIDDATADLRDAPLVDRILADPDDAEGGGTGTDLAEAVARAVGPLASALDDAAAAGAIGPGPAHARARTVIAVFAAIARSRPPIADPDHPPDPRMPAYVIDGLLAAWGADPRRLTTLAPYFEPDA